MRQVAIMNSDSIIHSWPYHWYGFWKSLAHDHADLPTLQAATDPDWNPEDRNLLIAYLTHSPTVVSSMSVSGCLLCEYEVPSLCYHSDGIWLWPDSLAHYVRSHHVVLPSAFVHHIRCRDYESPTETTLPDIAVRDLPWPESWASMRNLTW